jgi:hypothetical protein
MTRARKSKRLRKVVFALLILTYLIVWFVTASASTAVQRIAAGTGRGPIARVVIDGMDVYSSPMVYVCKIRSLSRISDYLEDFWCEFLDAPETTP